MSALHVDRCRTSQLTRDGGAALYGARSGLLRERPLARARAPPAGRAHERIRALVFSAKNLAFPKFSPAGKLGRAVFAYCAGAQQVACLGTLQTNHENPPACVTCIPCAPGVRLLVGGASEGLNVNPHMIADFTAIDEPVGESRAGRRHK